MKKLLIVIIMIATVISSLCSCGCTEMGEVSVFYYSFSDTYISTVRGAMDKMLDDGGIYYHNYDANSSQATQTEQIDTAIAKGSTMLIVNIVDSGSDDAARTIVDKAKAADIPLIFFNRSVREDIVKSYEKCVFVGTDYEMAGKMQGDLIGKYVLENYSALDINGDGVISYCLFKGEQGNAESEARTKYAVENANAVLKAGGKRAISFYDKANANGYLVDQDGNWSNAAANNYMKTILSAYSEKNGNMVELIIANNDEMALGAISALNEAGYNNGKGRTIPVFGIDATSAAVSKINSGAMTGTIKQDGEGMAKTIATIVANLQTGKSALYDIDEENTIGGWRVNIPYSTYTSEGQT